MGKPFQEESSQTVKGQVSYLTDQEVISSQENRITEEIDITCEAILTKKVDITIKVIFSD